MMACASGGWRAISSSVTSSDMPSCCGKARTWPARLPHASPRAATDYSIPIVCPRSRPRSPWLLGHTVRPQRGGGLGDQLAVAHGGPRSLDDATRDGWGEPELLLDLLVPLLSGAGDGLARELLFLLAQLHSHRFLAKLDAGFEEHLGQVCLVHPGRVDDLRGRRFGGAEELLLEDNRLDHDPIGRDREE